MLGDDVVERFDQTVGHHGHPEPMFLQIDQLLARALDQSGRANQAAFPVDKILLGFVYEGIPAVGKNDHMLHVVFPPFSALCALILSIGRPCRDSSSIRRQAVYRSPASARASGRSALHRSVQYRQRGWK